MQAKYYSSGARIDGFPPELANSSADSSAYPVKIDIRLQTLTYI